MTDIAFLLGAVCGIVTTLLVQEIIAPLIQAWVEERRAAIAYTKAADATWRGLPAVYGVHPPGEWPFPDFWKQSEDPIRNLVKAGALIAAEIDRLQRCAMASRAKEGRDEAFAESLNPERAQAQGNPSPSSCGDAV